MAIADRINEMYTHVGDVYDTITNVVVSTGKNILPYQEFPTKTVNGITITNNNDGTFKVNGTATADVSEAINPNNFISMTGTWRMLGCPSGGSANTYMLSAYVGYWGAGSPNIDIGNGTNITYTGNVKIRFYIKNGTTCNNLIFKPMMTTDTTATINDFEPYTDNPTNKNIENIPKVIRNSYLEIMNNGIDKIWNNWEKVTGEGTELSLSPTLEAPMKNVLNGNTYQFTTTGKNKLDTTGYTSRSVTGITITPNYEGDMLKNIKVSGTPTATNWVVMKNFSLSAGTYILNGINISQTSKTGLRIGLYIDSSRQWFITSNSPTYTFTLNETTTCQFVIWVQSVADFPTTDTYITPMIRLSSVTDSTYEPYTGGQASPNPQYPQDIHVVSGDNTINVTGRNLAEEIEYGDIIAQTGVETSVTTSIKLKNYIPYDKNSTYYLSVNNVMPTSVGINLRFYNKNKEYIGYSTLTGSGRNFYITKMTSVIDDEAKYFRFRQTLSVGPITSLDDKVMITTINNMNYESYSSNSYPINLPIENLFDKNTDIVFGSFYNSTGEVQTGNGLFLQSSYIKVEPNTEYTFSGNYEDYFRMCEYNSSKTFIQRQISTNGDTKYITYTTTANTQYIRISCNSTNVNSLQIERDNKINSYTPYGTTPIELCNFNTYKDNFLRTSGKNLLPNNATTQTINGVTFKVNDDKSATLNGTASAIADFYMFGSSTDTGEYLYIPKGTYSISTPSSGWFYIGREKTLGAVVGNSALLNALSSQDCYFYGFIIRATSGSSFSNLTLFPMINKGSTALPYEPYGSGEWYKCSQIGKTVLNGSESWYAETQRYRLDNIIQGKTFSTFDENNPLAYCNGFKWGNGVSNNYVYGAFWYTTNGLNLSMQKDENPNATTLANFKTWLESNNQKVYYVLATPTYTKITYEPLLEQLEAFYNAKSKNSQTNITQENNDLPFIIDSTMLKEV